MALARCEFDATDEAGNILTNVTVEVRRESDNALVSVYSDRAGTASLGNPFVAADGKVAFFAAGAAYRVVLTAGSSTRTLSYKPVGLAQELDYTAVGANLLNASNAAAARTAMGALGGSLGATDNRLLRSDGTGGVTAQGSPITVADDGAVSGVNTLTATGAMTLDRVGNAVFTVRGTAAPIWWFEATDSAVDKKIFQVVNNAGDFFLRSRTDAGAGVAEMFRCAHAGGMIIGSPTGGNKGLGTLNATAVYDDNTLLTCMALQREFREKGAIDLAKWDAMVPALVIPEQREQVPVRWPVKVSRVVAVTEPDEDGRLTRKVQRVEATIEVEAVIADPVYDEAGEIVDAVETPLFEEVVIPEQVIAREHRTARLFKAMIDDGFDPRDPEQYFARMQADEALPGMPSKATWEHNSLSAGEMMGRLWLAAEMQAIVANVMWGKIKDHEARLAALEGALPRSQ